MVEYKVISTKCPILNEEHKEQNAYGSSPILEVLVKLKDLKPIGVICPKYEINKFSSCSLHNPKGDDNCIYKKGWESLE